MLLSSVSK